MNGLPVVECIHYTYEIVYKLNLAKRCEIHYPIVFKIRTLLLATKISIFLIAHLFQSKNPKSFSSFIKQLGFLNLNLFECIFQV